MGEQKPAPEPADVAKALMTAMESFKHMAATVAGYRSQLVQGGIGAQVADQMALQLHELLVTSMQRQRTTVAGQNATAAQNAAAGRPEIPEWLRNPTEMLRQLRGGGGEQAA